MLTEAVEAGFDVIDCPNIPPRETVIANPSSIEIEAVYGINKSHDPAAGVVHGGTVQTPTEDLDNFAKEIMEKHQYYLTPIMHQNPSTPNTKLPESVRL